MAVKTKNFVLSQTFWLPPLTGTDRPTLSQTDVQRG